MVEVETEEVIKAMKVYHDAGGKTTYGKTRWAKGAKCHQERRCTV